MSPFFSIITPTYNRAKFLPDTIKSILQQSYENFEYIIIDDASTDRTNEINTAYSDPRLIYLRRKLVIKKITGTLK